MVELCKRYGVDTVLTLLEQIQDTSEEMVRAKLKKIPNGKWKAIHYNEGLNYNVIESGNYALYIKKKLRRENMK